MKNPCTEQIQRLICLVFVFCDLQTAARHIRRNNLQAARAFLEAAYDSFEFLGRHPGLGPRDLHTTLPD
jgi:plasmid stabilization system protein ParE